MVTFPSMVLKLSKSKRVPRAHGQSLRRWMSPCSIKWTSQPQAHTQYRSHVSHATTRAPSKTENGAILLEAHLGPRPPPGPFWFLRKYTQSLGWVPHSWATSPSWKRPVWAAVIPEPLIHNSLWLSIFDTYLSILSVLKLDPSLLQEGKFGQH